MKTIVIVLANLLFVIFLVLTLIFLNTYFNSLIIKDDLKGIWHYILRFLIVNLESILILTLFYKTVKIYVRDIQLSNRILMLDILIILLLSGLFFFKIYQEDI